MVRRHHHSLLSLLPFRVRFPEYFKPTLNTPLSRCHKPLAHTLESPSKKIFFFQFPHSARLSSFHLGAHPKVWWRNTAVAFWNFAEAIKHENFNFSVLMSLLGHGVDVFLWPMARLGHLGSLKSKQKLYWSYVKIETTWKWNYDLRKTF